MIARLLLATAAVIFMCASAAWSDGGQVTPGDDDFNASIEHVDPATVMGGATPGASAATPAPVSSEHQSVDVLTACELDEICSSLVCEPEPASPLGGMYVYRDGDAPPLNLGWCERAEAAARPPTPEVTPGLVLQAMRRIGLPASELVVQPPGGRTLVNFETNFYTENGEFTRTVTLLGQRVELRIWPASFGWRFGDGTTRQTTSAGSPYPDLEITHRYLRKGMVAPSVDTTYAARFRVNGGEWRDVDGTVTIPGAPEELRVVTARPVLVGG